MHTWGSVLFVIAVVVAVACVIIQRRALNRIAFGRSMFISWMAILTGLIVGMLPGIAATVVAVILLLLGYGFMVLMAVKSWQRLRSQRTRR
ncbi:MAG: hypothetical protein IRZ10_09505 [Thermoflavifilum sp.]|nr:hypothetical protein [Thermoflavifilum sp.]MCL6514643.1 hypothetical protein [Alicyclobacillus sp.]